MTRKQVTWMLGSGKQATVTVALVTSRVNYSDGYNVEVPCCELSISAAVDGLGCVGTGKPQPNSRPHPAQPHVIAKIGTLGLTKESLSLVNAAISEVAAMPEWQAKLALIADNERGCREYEAHRDRVEQMMTLGGRSY